MTHIDYFKNHNDYINYKAGEVIFQEGTTGKEMFAVKNGVVNILYNDKLLETVEPGGFFGEMALVDSSPRSATAVAQTDCQVVGVDKYHFMFLVQESPMFALHVMHVMAARIRRVNQTEAQKA